MSRLIVRKLGLLAAVTVLLTASAPSFAAPPADDPSVYLTKKKTSTLVGLSPAIQASAVEKARSSPNATKLTTQGGSTQGAGLDGCTSDGCLDAFCGDDWFVTWDEDANGNAISHTFQLHCGGATVNIG